MSKKARKLIVTVPVADLSSEPKECQQSYVKDPLRQTQLLLGEHLLGLDQEGEWIFVEALEQEKCLPDGSWRGYPGWVHHSHVRTVDVFPKKSLTQPQNIARVRQQIIAEGKEFCGAPYLWGGRSPYCPQSPGVVTSFDCSGFVHFLYRHHGMTIPRDAHDQFLRSQKRKGSELQVGELIFLAPISKPERIDHVMLYAGNNQLLEATARSSNIRLIDAKERLDIPIKKCEEGRQSFDHYVFMGSLF